MRRLLTVGLIAGNLLLIPGVAVFSQQVESVVRSIDGAQPLIRPTQVILSPTGDRVAISDPDGHRIYVIDSDGHPVWTVGSNSIVTHPVLIDFDSDNSLLYYEVSQRTVFRSTEANPEAVDTIVSFPDSVLSGLHLDRIVPVKHGQKGFLFLDREKSAIYKLNADWTLDKKLISSGSRKGKLWSPADFVLDLSSNIIVADESGCPMQAFTSDGSSLFCGSWNLKDAERSWTASAVGIGPGEIIWAADVTNLTWRLFDRAGIQIAQYPFAQPILKPNGLVFTPDKRLFIAEDNGAVIVLSLPN